MLKLLQKKNLAGSSSNFDLIYRESVKDGLIRETSLILHETVGVRIEGLKVLQKTFKDHMPVIQNLIIGSDEPDPCIKTLLESLVSIFLVTKN